MAGEKKVIEEMDSIIHSALTHRKHRNSAFEMLEMGIKMEKLAKEYYLELAKKVSDKTGNVMFKYLAIEEAGHIKELMNQLDAMKKSRDWIKREKVPAATCPVAVPEEREIRTMRDIVPKDLRIPKNTNDLEALKMAIDIKKRMIRFYCAASESMVGADGKKMLAKLISAENRHLNDLMVQYAWLDQAGFWYDASMMTD